MTTQDRKFEFEIEVLYGRKSDNDLNARLDVTAEKLGGTFLSFVQLENVCKRKFGFSDEEMADDFLEEANFIISRHFSFTPISLDDVPARLRWSFDEAVYHHIEFLELHTAKRFATWFRAVYSTYMEPDMFDIFIVKPLDENSGHMVIWAFPVESVVPGMLSEEEELDEEMDEILDSINVKKNDKKVLN